jgi:signal transduction histidine kinase
MPLWPDRPGVLEFDDALRARYANASVGCFVMVPGRIVWGNAAAAAIWRSKSVEHMLARDFSTDSDIAQRIIDGHFDELRSVKGFRGQWTILPDGEPVQVVLAYRAMRVDDSVGLLIEATECDPESFDAYASRMAMTTMHVDLGITLFDTHGDVVDQNNAAGAWHGAATLSERFVDETVAHGAIEQALEGAVFEIETRMRTREGPRWRAVALRRVFDPATGASLLLLHEADIERLRRAEQALEERNADLAEKLDTIAQMQQQIVLAEKLATVGSLVAGLAHELNTPVGVIRSSADTATAAFGKVLSADGHRRERFSEIVTTSHVAIADATKRIADLVEDLTAFGRLDGPEHEVIDLCGALDAACDRAQRGADVAFERHYTPPVLVHGQSSHINQLLYNLIVHAAASATTIRLEARRDGDVAVVSIDDDGEGYDDSALAHLFDPTFSTSGRRIALGMSLPLCAAIVARHGGTIDVASAGVARGTTMTVRLPASA